MEVSSFNAIVLFQLLSNYLEYIDYSTEGVEFD